MQTRRSMARSDLLMTGMAQVYNERGEGVIVRGALSRQRGRTRSRT